MKRLLPLLAFFFSALVVHAQPASNATGAQQVVSPEIAADRAVTFRLYAPNAKTVTVNGDVFPQPANGPAMTKDAAGVWSYTLPPQDPGIYGYFFRVDGVRQVDPSNLFISASAEYLKSYVDIPGATPQFWSVQDVPHGQLHEVWYRNPSLGQRRVIVYTPPGYNPAENKTYPVLVLMHSTSDNETFWSRIGRANLILDNLLAEGKSRPMLLVMAFGHTSVPRGPEEGAGGKDLYDVSVIGRDIVDYVLPLVAEKFHGSTLAREHGVFGFSMGGFHAVTIGLNYADQFGYIVGSSATFRANTDLAANFAPWLAAGAPGKGKLQYVAMMTGTGEAAAIPQSKRVVDYLTGQGCAWIGPRRMATTPGTAGAATSANCSSGNFSSMIRMGRRRWRGRSEPATLSRWASMSRSTTSVGVKTDAHPIP